MHSFNMQYPILIADLHTIPELCGDCGLHGVRGQPSHTRTDRDSAARHYKLQTDLPGFELRMRRLAEPAQCPFMHLMYDVANGNSHYF